MQEAYNGSDGNLWWVSKDNIPALVVDGFSSKAEFQDGICWADYYVVPGTKDVYYRIHKAE